MEAARHLSLVILAFALAAFSLLGVWAGLSRRPWFIRGSAVCGALALLVPIAAYGPMLIVMIAVPAIGLASSAFGRWFDWPTFAGNVVSPDRPGKAIRFRLSDLLEAHVLAGVALTLIVVAWRNDAFIEWPHLLGSAVARVLAHGSRNAGAGGPLFVGQRLSESAKRDREAADFGLATVQVGNMLARGGLVMHSLVGIAIEGVGADELSRIRADVSIAKARKILAKLQEVERSREPFGVTRARDMAWEEKAYHWVARYEHALNSIMVVDTGPTAGAMEAPVHRRNAILRLLATEFALRLFLEEQGRLPDRLDELSPRYVSAVPADPFSGEPFIYRRLKGGFCLYSVGPDGQDDGGKFGSMQEILSVSGFDLDLDAVTRPPARLPTAAAQ